MSLAIENLKAMLNTEDVDLLIELLQDNDWDESLAASAFMARQTQHEAVELPTTAQSVRPPIPQRQEQLIQNPPPMDRMATMLTNVDRATMLTQVQEIKQKQAREIAKPRVYQILNLIDEEVKEVQAQPGIFRRMGSAIFKVAKEWMFCSNQENDE